MLRYSHWICGDHKWRDCKKNIDFFFHYLHLYGVSLIFCIQSPFGTYFLHALCSTRFFIRLLHYYRNRWHLHKVHV
ncbi:Uncharacterized protein APZ42_003707 [Daphnia magna]|uniref:Uncharacterized protein n=1 Tax=Daphnia magna TaxID=35525 RepID=A0A168EK48_9CRUS|nr:Uncharacterized protein APZ42_003707 [Daphnia magna]